MKYKIHIYSLMIVMVWFSSCQKEEDRAILTIPEAPSLASSVSEVVLTEEDAENNAVTFSWNNVNYGFQAATAYALEMSATEDFAELQSLTLGSGPDSTITTSTLNNILTKLNLPADNVSPIYVRVKSELLTPNGASNQVDPLYSNPLTLMVTPYSTVVEPGYLYVPGAYQGWDPVSAATLISAEDNGEYVGYITFEDPAGLEFKITVEPNWNVNYGGDGEGNLIENGDNLSVPDVGTFQIMADINTLTWQANPYSWGIIGDATGSWEEDQNMVYDYENQVWTITTQLNLGALKFRLNDDWGTNYGDDDTSNNLLNAGGADIAISEAGTYTIELNLQDPENPTYTLTK